MTMTKAVRTGLMAATLIGATLTGAAFAQQGPVPQGVPHLDHVWVVMMENHGYSQILNNPAEPFVNQYAKSANLATNYFAVAHPSLTNYLETVGGSNFGVQDDNSPDWHSGSCTTNLQSTPNLETSGNAICPIAGSQPTQLHQRLIPQTKLLVARRSTSTAFAPTTRTRTRSA